MKLFEIQVFSLVFSLLILAWMSDFCFSLYLEKYILSSVCLCFQIPALLSKEKHSVFKQQQLITSSENTLNSVFILTIVI